MALCAIYFQHIDKTAEGIKILCHTCQGDADGCPTCDDKGTIYIKGKIQDTLTGDARVLFEAYAFLKDYNIWPDAGGMKNQNSKFLHCVKYCDMVNLKLKDWVDKTVGQENKRRAEMVRDFNLKKKG